MQTYGFQSFCPEKAQNGLRWLQKYYFLVLYEE